jgi:hypothetical protein
LHFQFKYIALKNKVLLMKDQDIHAELSSIRDLMERSAKFISLSGLSGVMAGIYAIIGAALGRMVLKEEWAVLDRDHYVDEYLVIAKLFFIALSVLVLSIGTGIWLSIRKAKKNGQPFWNTGSQRLAYSYGHPFGCRWVVHFYFNISWLLRHCCSRYTCFLRFGLGSRQSLHVFWRKRLGDIGDFIRFAVCIDAWLRFNFLDGGFWFAPHYLRYSNAF